MAASMYDAAFVERAQRLYDEYEVSLASLTKDESIGKTMNDDTSNEQEEKAEIERLTERLEAVTRRRDEARIRREYIRGKLHEGGILRDKLNARINNLEDKYRDTLGNVDSAKRNNVSIAADLDKSMQLNVLNDAFYIWYSGPFGTINNFRIGNVPTKPIEWSEINAALGETALALSVIVSRIPKNQFQFTKFELYPMGSYSKVYKKESSTIFAQWSNNSNTVTEGGAVGPAIPQGAALMNLYMDLNATFSLFPKSKFNAAIYGLMYCIYELGTYISSHDPPLCLPYEIDVGDESGRTCTISPRNPVSQAHRTNLDLFWSGNTSAGAYNEQDEQWTRALKFALADVKWIIAWSSKHH